MNTNPFALDPSRRRRRPGSKPPRPGTWLPFVGSGALVAIGYMDPGNWATALAGGASYGYTLLSVVILSSLMAMLLQWVSSRLGVVTGRDLAQLCRERTGRRMTLLLWVASEIAIIACDVAEVVGSAVALQLLFGVSLTAGVLMSAVGTFAMLALQRHGQRTLETVVVALILFVGLCFRDRAGARAARLASRADGRGTQRRTAAQRRHGVARGGHSGRDGDAA
jgi:manganese transport protein